MLFIFIRSGSRIIYMLHVDWKRLRKLYVMEKILVIKFTEGVAKDQCIMSDSLVGVIGLEEAKLTFLKLDSYSSCLCFV